ncbi:MAG: hypothetical protein LUF02_04915 [Erysipelotrichaceae bacterium]|nr:hypothetical protein [Erysipelotrichaceae bacterium]
MKLEELYEKYVYDIQLERKKSSLDSFMYKYKVAYDFYGNCEIEEITYDSVKNLQRYLFIEREFSAVYTNHIVRVVKQLLEFAYKHDYIGYYCLDNINNVQDTRVVEKEYYDLKTYQEFSSFISDKEDHLIFDMLFFFRVKTW